MDDDKELVVRSIEAANRRRTEFIASVPKELSDREDVIRKHLSRENASSRSKLRKVYNLVNELMEYSKPYTACDKGCSSCCNINVMISEVEAELIAQKIGTKPVPLRASKSREVGYFNGIPCPFLKSDACSIYEDRPYVCRQHVCFDESSYWCDPIRTNDVKEMPLLRFTEAEAAVLDIGKLESGGIFADIRDFFPHV